MISFVAFSASLLGENHALPLAASIYGANYFMARIILWRELFRAGIVRHVHWAHVTNGSRLAVRKLDPELVLHIKLVFMSVPYVKPTRHTRHLT